MEAVEDRIKQELADTNQRAKELQEALDLLLRGNRNGGEKVKRYDPRQVAGEKNIERVRLYMQRVGQARQKDVGTKLRKNPGTISCAFAVLEAEGEVKSLPKKERRSTVWEWIGEERPEAKQKQKPKAKV